jgi:hypothetical protein
MKQFFIYGGVGIAAIAGLAMTDLGGMAYNYFTAPLRGMVEAQRTVTSGASRIQRYEEFFNICQSIQAKELAIDSLNANSTMDAAKRDTAITANQSARGKLISEYNSKASMAYTYARFKASNLPYSIQSGLYEGNSTNCNAN